MRHILNMVYLLFLMVGLVRPPVPQPRRWLGMVHLKARFYQNYRRAVDRAAKRKRGRAVDIDGQDDKDGVLWALHWATVGANKLHDPYKRIHRKRRIDSLTTAEVARLRGPRNQRPWKMISICARAFDKKVRVELEAKSNVSQVTVNHFMARIGKAMTAKGLLQVKTLVSMGGGTAAINRLAPWQKAGAVTILSFSGTTRSVSKRAATGVVDYTRGRARWTA